MKITSDFDADANFPRFKTYSWIPEGQKKTGDPRLDSLILHGRIRQAVEKQLATQRYKKINLGTPDFWVAYHVAIEKKVNAQFMNDYNNYGPGWAYTYGDTYAPPGFDSYVHEYVEGSLVLDLVDPKTRKLQWRGSAQAEVNLGLSSEKKEKRINIAV